MYKNFLVILLRNLYREKSYATINVFGLALALSCSLILICYIKHEMAYDQHNVNYERIVRINSIVTTNGKEERSAFSSIVTGPLFLSEYPQIGEYVVVEDRSKWVKSRLTGKILSSQRRIFLKSSPIKRCMAT